MTIAHPTVAKCSQGVNQISILNQKSKFVCRFVTVSLLALVDIDLDAASAICHAIGLI